MADTDELPYVYRWDRQERKGQPCKVTARGKFNSIRVVFEDGYTMITSGERDPQASPTFRPGRYAIGD